MFDQLQPDAADPDQLAALGELDPALVAAAELGLVGIAGLVVGRGHLNHIYSIKKERSEN